MVGVSAANVFVTSVVPNGASTTVVVTIAGLTNAQLASVSASLAAAAASGLLQSAMAAQIPGVSVTVLSITAADDSGNTVTVNSPPPPSSSSGSSSNSNNALAIGLGVGLGVGGLIIIVVIVIVVMKKKKTQEQTVRAVEMKA